MVELSVKAQDGALETVHPTAKAKKNNNSFRSPRASLQNLRVNGFFFEIQKKIPLVFHLQKSM